MRLLMLSKALVVGEYQRKAEEIAASPGVAHFTVVVPPSWQEPGGRELRLERAHTVGYDLRVEPIRFNGSFHLFFWPGLRRVLKEVQPDVVHVDEEPYNLATFLATLQARRVGARPLFFTWQNLPRRYPPPFSLFERYVYRHSIHAIAGNRDAESVVRQKGYRGPVSVIPQFGVDPGVFSPAERDLAESRVPTIGFVGRVVEEKGILVLLEALANLNRPWRLHVVGAGPLLETARREAAQCGIANRVTWEPGVPSADVPARMRSFDVLVLPSLTRPNWKEQFGRALVEAMACQVPVIGSASGEIPHVIGDAGLLVPEGDHVALRDALLRLLSDPDLRQELGRRGRQRVLARYTHSQVARETVEVYQQALAARP